MNNEKRIMKSHPELILSCPISITGFNRVNLSCLSCVGQLPEKELDFKIHSETLKSVFCLKNNSETGNDGGGSMTAVVTVLKECHGWWRRDCPSGGAGWAVSRAEELVQGSSK